METQNDIINAIAKHLGVTPADIDLHSSLTGDLGLGPIEISDLLDDLSKVFNVTIVPQEAAQIVTVSDLVVMIEDLLLD